MPHPAGCDDEPECDAWTLIADRTDEPQRRSVAAAATGPPSLEIIGDPEGQFCGQHGSELLPYGHLVLFDNGVMCMQDPYTSPLS